MFQSVLHCQCLHGHFMSMVYVKNKETTCMALCSNESKWVFPLDVSCVKQVLLFDICINSQQVQTCLKSMLSCWQCEILQHKWCHNELSHCRHNFNSNILQRAYILLYSGFLFNTFGRLALLSQKLRTSTSFSDLLQKGGLSSSAWYVLCALNSA